MFYWLRRLLRWVFTPFIVLILLFEEWGWEPLAALMQRFAQLPFWAWCERKIAKLSPWEAMLVLVVPAVALFPIKLLALFFVHRGQVALGFAVLVAAKLIGTAFVARLFQLTEPALMQFAWFAKWYPRWKIWKDALLVSVRASALWRTGRSIKLAVRLRLRLAWRKFKARD
jgi:hypothetical protein